MSNLDILKEGIKEIKASEDTKLAKETLRYLNFLLEDKAEEENWPIYEEYKSELELYAFRYFSEEDMMNFFSKGLEKLLRAEDINFIIDGLKYFLYSYWHIEDYNIMREKLLQNLYENKELLTETNVSYKNGRELEGSIKNWFKNYQIQFDHNKEFRIGMMEYLNKGFAISKLSKKEKEAVKNLIYLVEYLRADAEENLREESSYVLELGEGEYLIVNDGNVLDTKDVEADYKKSQELKDVFAEYLYSPANAEKKVGTENVLPAKVQAKQDASENENFVSLKEKIQLSEEEMINFRNIIAKYKALPDDDIMNYFWEGLDSYNKYLIMGALQELVRRQQWEEIWDIPRLRLLLNDYRSRKLKDLSVNPDDKKANLKLLLLFILEQHLSLPVDNAKKWALYLVNWLAKNGYGEYKDLIYFDKGTGRLEWEK